jgi:hypothetical protein
MLPYNIPGLPFQSLLKNAEEMKRIVKKVIAREEEEGLTGYAIALH